MSAFEDGIDSGRHLGELAELYALGALEPDERASVDAHAAACVPCSRALGAAAATIAALDASFVPQHDAPPPLAARIAASAARPQRSRALPAWYATAAALVLAAAAGGTALVEHRNETRQAAHDSAILATIATSHFNHVTLQARAANAPVAKVLYARDGAWWYVIVDSAACGCRVIARSNAGMRDLGAPEPRGTTSTLYVSDFPHPTSIVLADPAGSALAEAPLIYPAR